MEKKLQRYGLLFITPFFAFYLVFNLYPIIHTFLISFTRYDGFKAAQIIWFDNYKNLIIDKFFWRSFFNTWKIWLPNIVMQISLALGLATILTNSRLRIKGLGFFRAVFYFPNLVTAASVAMLAIVLLDWQHGAFNQLLFGNNKERYINWMIDPHRAQFVISIIQTWMWFGNSLIILVAGLQAIPQTYYEAAEIDGAHFGQIFLKITVPLLSPILVYIMVTSLIGGMQIFDIPYVMATGPAVTGTGEAAQSIETMVVYLYNIAFKYNRFGYASAVSYLLFGIIAVFSFIYLKIFAPEEA